MVRKLVAVLGAAALVGCAELPTDARSDMAAQAALLAPQFSGTVVCVLFTEDGVEIEGSEDCSPDAFGLDISFAPPAKVRIGTNGNQLDSPRGITGLRTSFDGPGSGRHGGLTDMQWLQGTRVINRSVLPTGAAGATRFEVEARKFTDVRWIGGGPITIPKGANDIHYSSPFIITPPF